MYGTSPEMLKRMYVVGSLKNQDEGFVLQVKNLIESGSVSGVSKLSVDGQERSGEGITLQIGDKVRKASEVNWSSPLYVNYGATLTIYVPGKLEPGAHTVNLQFYVPELGSISMPITDTIG